MGGAVWVDRGVADRRDHGARHMNSNESLLAGCLAVTLALTIGFMVGFAAGWIIT